MLTILEIVVSVLLIASILLQERSSGLSSGVFGGSDGNTSYQTRRGLEKGIYWATIILSVLFVVLALLKLSGVGV